MPNAILGTDPSTGTPFTKSVRSETDVLVVFEDARRHRIALHIENKRATGAFTPLQPELYPVRARKWLGDPEYGAYDDFKTVLVAPRIFRTRSLAGAAEFDRYLAHEEVAEWVPAFDVVGQKGSVLDRWAESEPHLIFTPPSDARETPPDE